MTPNCRDGDRPTARARTYLHTTDVHEQWSYRRDINTTTKSARESDSGFEVNGAPTPGPGTWGRGLSRLYRAGQKCLNADLRSRRRRNPAAVVAGHIAPEDIGVAPSTMPRYLYAGG